MSHALEGLELDSRLLIPIVAAALDEPAVELGGWQAEPLHGGLEAGNRLLRFSGQARTPAQAERPWSLVLKIVSRTPESETDPQGLHYWQREALAYQSGLLAGLPCGITAPRCYNATQESAGEIWLWLEEVQDAVGKPWPLEHHRQVASCLGCANGVYLSGHPLPGEPWLTRGWLRKYVENAAPIVQKLPELRKVPLFQRTFPRLADDFLLAAWERRGQFLQAIERLPQTFCHLDAFSGNLFWRPDRGGQGQLVAVDWAFAGIAALGEELAPLVIMSATPENSAQLYETCLEGYLAGLGESGWHGDPDLVRFSSQAALFYRYVFGAILGEGWLALQDERNYPLVAARFGVPQIELVVDQIGSMNPVYRQLYENAGRLLDRI